MAIKENVMVFTVGMGSNKREMKMHIKLLNYIIYSDMIELIDQELVDELDVVK